MRCDNALRTTVRSRLLGFDVAQRTSDALRPAAVAVVILEEGPGAALEGVAAPSAWSDHAALLLTRRAKTLRRHAGQWALPGGRVDPGETFEQAALRELSEEVGLHLDSDSVLGRLDDIPTRSGFLMAPIVIWGGMAATLEPNPAEVASVHRIPLSELLRDDAPMLDPPDDGEHPVLRMPIGNSWIAAPTAAVLYQFREVVLRAVPVRVAHFGQPKFTWR